MWYKIAIQGRIITRINDFENRLKKLISESLIKRKSGLVHLDFYKVNMFLDENMRKYIKQIMPQKLEDSLGGIDLINKIIYLPFRYNPNVYDSIIHEFVHGIHAEDIKGLKIHGSMLYENIYAHDLGDTYQDFYNKQFLSYLNNLLISNILFKNAFLKFSQDKKFNNKLEAFEAFFDSEIGSSFLEIKEKFEPILNEDDWKAGKYISRRIKPEYDLYWATNEEMLAFFHNAVLFFSVDNLMKVYEKFYRNRPESYIKDVSEAFYTIGFTNARGYESFAGLSYKMRDLISKIKIASGITETSGLNKIIDAQWWKQLAKNITNNFLEVEKIVAKDLNK